MQTLTLVAGCVLILAAAALLATLQVRLRARSRLFALDATIDDVEEDEPPDADEGSRLARWLVRAGYRRRNAPALFVTSCLTSVALGVALALGLLYAPLLPAVAAGLAGLPVLGGVAVTLLGIAPWVVAVGVAAAPVLWVRARRRERCEEIERDLPLALELLATLAEAGFGFDASVAKLVGDEGGERPLYEELRLYQLECQTGVGRVRCLERLGRRIDLPVVTDMISALTHAEEVGSGLSAILRPQAEDLRQRRREKALALAEALPEKLVVPLLLGFLPGLLVWTLGPAFHQLFGMLDAALG